MLNAQFGRIGDRITATYQMDGLPVGSRIRDSSSSYTKISMGSWQRDPGGQTYRTAQFTGGTYTVDLLPEGFVPCDKPQETIESYMFRIRDRALAAANSNGVSYEASADTLHAAGVPRGSIPMGHGVEMQDRREVERLPAGTVVWCGDPMDLQNFGVFRKINAGNSWEQILGGARSMQAEVTIHTYEGSMTPPEWLTRPGTEEDAEKIRQFKAVLWQRGWELKRQQSWCSTYESVMRGLGITQQAVREARTGSALVGTRVAPDGAAAQPIGTVFRWDAESGGEWAMFVRVEGTQNIAGTRKIAGSPNSGNRNYHSSMQIVALAPENGRNSVDGLAQIPFQDLDWLQYLLPGSLFNTSQGASARYVACRDGRLAPFRVSGAIPDVGQYSSRDFSTYETLHYYGWDGVAR